MKGREQHTYDAIVVGTGISGGWAAMELCRKGLKTLVLERGRPVKHGDYPTANLDTWDLPYQDHIPHEEKEAHYPKLSRKNYLMRQQGIHWFAKDDEYPYTEKRRFDWIRGYHTGGRSIMWGRQCYRLTDLDFEANAREGIAVDWPIRYRDIEPWYDHVTRFVGISGQSESSRLKNFPDGPFLPAMPLNCVEEEMRNRVMKKYDSRVITPARMAHLTAYDPEVHLGKRGNCQYRNRCVRGCPYGGYFSSVSATLPVAEETGNMHLLNHAAVREVIYDADTGRATGVRVRQTDTGEDTEFFSRGVIFLCASTLHSAAILLASKSDAQPNGLGNDSDQVGRNVMDHHHSVGARASFPGLFEDKYYKGRKPGSIYIPRFVNLGDRASQRDYLRGFGYQGGAYRGTTRNGAPGVALKASINELGEWSATISAFGESLPDPNNRITLNEELLDKDGLPTLIMDCAFGENEKAMRKDMSVAAAEIMEAAGGEDIRQFGRPVYPGYSIHEMGSARMGRDPKTSVLNAHNQVWNCTNLYVTDGSGMTSASCVNPSLTYMALTARAVDHAVKSLDRRDI